MNPADVRDVVGMILITDGAGIPLPLSHRLEQ